jgi:hypothetical protein
LKCLVLGKILGVPLYEIGLGVLFSENPLLDFKLYKSTSKNTKTDFSQVLMKWVA